MRLFAQATRPSTVMRERGRRSSHMSAVPKRSSCQAQSFRQACPHSEQSQIWAFEKSERSNLQCTATPTTTTTTTLLSPPIHPPSRCRTKPSPTSPPPASRVPAAAPSRMSSPANTPSTCTREYVQFDEVHGWPDGWRDAYTHMPYAATCIWGEYVPLRHS